MLASAIPTKIQLPFAASGDKVTIPVPSQVAITDGRASFTTGFPPLNATPLSAGGVAPFWTDFNGLLNQVTAVQQWQCAGGIFKYDVDFSTAIGGYPKYCILMGTTGIEYLNLADNNTTDPDSLASANWGSRKGVTPAQSDNNKNIATTDWVNGNGTKLSGLTQFNSTATITPSQCYGMIEFYGTGTFSVNLPLKSTVKDGQIVEFANFSGGIVNLLVQGSDVIFINQTAPQVAITMLPGDTFRLIATVIGWLAIGGSAQLKYSSSFASDLVSSGWRKSPDGSIEQWGVVAAGAAGSPSTFSFPIPFPSQCLQMVVSQADAAAGTIAAMAADWLSSSTFRVASASSTPGILARWRAIGK